MDILRSLEEALNSGDETVRTWFLIGSSYGPITLCTCYVIFCTIIGPAIMKNRKPFDLRMTMIVYNFSVVAAYVYSMIIIILYAPTLSYEEFCKGSYVDNGGPRYKLACVGYLIYIVKYVEFLDTVFFILRKKNNLITFLHVVHHFIIPLAGWIILRTEKSGYQAIPVLINASVHIVMYSYYGLAAMGPQVRKYLWWKKYLTQLQIMQFVIIIVFVAIVVPLSGCTMLGTSYLMDMILGFMFLGLFVKFYKSTFLRKEPTNSEREMEDSRTEYERNEIEVVEKRLVTNGRKKKE